MIFQAPSTIQALRTLADNTIRMQVDFQELSPEEMGSVFKLKGKLGWFLFKENPFQSSEVPEEPTPEIGGKSPSKKLHDRMLAYYMKKYGNSDGFNEWRVKQMEKIGQQYLDMIEE